MKILLIFPPVGTSLPTKGSFPLGLGYISSVLLGMGCSVDILDININQFTRGQVLEKIKEAKNYDLIGITGMVTVYGYIKWLTEVIKDSLPGIPLVVGGTVTSAMPELFLQKTRADIVCIGEGEETVKELVAAIHEKRDFELVKGIYFKRGERITKNPHRKLKNNLDNIPFPAWHLFQIERYIKHHYIVDCPSNSMNLIAGRGCPYRCTFCYRNFGRNVRYRSIDNIIEEIRTLKEKYKVTHFEFQDELFTLNDKRVAEFCNRIIKEKLKITWRCLGRVNLVKYEILKLMKEAGCYWLGYGVESGSQRMLDSMNKEVKVAEAKEAIRLTRKAGINVSATFMVGMPGETRESIRETVEFCKEMEIFNVPFFTVPYPGTFLYQGLKNKGVVDDEESFILKMGKDATNLLINMTDIPDDELIMLKKEAEEEIREFIKQKHKNMKFMAKLKYVLSNLISEYKYWGIKGVKREILRLRPFNIIKRLSNLSF